MAEITEEQVGSIVEHFDNLPDPRSTVNQRHRLTDVIVICICGVLAGTDGPSAIAQWGRVHADWLKKHLPLSHGIPSHDTIWRRTSQAFSSVVWRRKRQDMVAANLGRTVNSTFRRISQDATVGRA